MITINQLVKDGSFSFMNRGLLFKTFELKMSGLPYNAIEAYRYINGKDKSYRGSKDDLLILCNELIVREFAVCELNAELNIGLLSISEFNEIIEFRNKLIYEKLIRIDTCQ